MLYREKVTHIAPDSICEARDCESDSPESKPAKQKRAPLKKWVLEQTGQLL